MNLRVNALAIRMDRRRHSTSVIDVLSDLFFLRGVPGHVRADNGPKLIAKAMQAWIRAVSAKTAFITPGSPWKNGYIESFNARMRNELINSKLFYSLNKTSIVIGNGQHYYDSIRPHSSIEYKAPATEMFVLAAQHDRLGPRGQLRRLRSVQPQSRRFINLMVDNPITADQCVIMSEPSLALLMPPLRPYLSAGRCPPVKG